VIAPAVAVYIVHEVLDALAYAHALKDERIGYLGLDVYEEEDALGFFQDRSADIIPDDTFARLLTFPNVLITAHQGFFTEEALANIAETTIANLTGNDLHGSIATWLQPAELLPYPFAELWLLRDNPRLRATEPTGYPNGTVIIVDDSCGMSEHLSNTAAAPVPGIFICLPDGWSVSNKTVFYDTFYCYEPMMDSGRFFTTTSTVDIDWNMYFNNSNCLCRFEE